MPPVPLNTTISSSLVAPSPMTAYSMALPVLGFVATDRSFREARKVSRSSHSRALFPLDVVLVAGEESLLDDPQAESRKPRRRTRVEYRLSTSAPFSTSQNSHASVQRKTKSIIARFSE